MILAVKQETDHVSRATLSGDVSPLPGGTGKDLDLSQSVSGYSKCDDVMESKYYLDSQLTNTSFTSTSNSIHSPSPSSASATNSIHSPSYSSQPTCSLGSCSQPSVVSSGRRSRRRGRLHKHIAPTSRHSYPKHITRSVSKTLKEFEGEALSAPEVTTLEPSPLTASFANKESHSRKDHLCGRKEELAPDESHTCSTKHPITGTVCLDGNSVTACLVGCASGRRVSHGNHPSSLGAAQIGVTSSTLLPTLPHPLSCKGGELSCDSSRNESTAQV